MMNCLSFQAVVKVVSNEECQSMYSTDNITDQMLCAGLPEGGVGACLVKILLQFQH